MPTVRQCCKPGQRGEWYALSPITAIARFLQVAETWRGALTVIGLDSGVRRARYYHDVVLCRRGLTLSTQQWHPDISVLSTRPSPQKHSCLHSALSLSDVLLDSTSLGCASVIVLAIQKMEPMCLVLKTPCAKATSARFSSCSPSLRSASAMLGTQREHARTLLCKALYERRVCSSYYS